MQQKSNVNKCLKRNFEEKATVNANIMYTSLNGCSHESVLSNSENIHYVDKMECLSDHRVVQHEK